MDNVLDLRAVRGALPDRLRKVNLWETARFFCDVYVAGPGQSQAAHVHAASDKVYVVIGGAGVVTVDGIAHAVEEGHAVFCPAGSTHGVQNPGPGDLRLLVFMAPHPKPPPAAPQG